MIEKNRPLADRFNVAKRAAEERWLRSLEPKNGFLHSYSVERYLDQLIPDKLKEDMTAAEIFILLYSTYLHDIGRKFVEKDGHEKASLDEISANFKEYYLNEHEARAVGLVSYGHSPEDVISIQSIPDNFGIDNIDPNKTLNLKFLTALLRLADEIDNAFTRVWGLVEHKYNERKLINFVLVDQTRWIITFQHGPLSDGVRRRLLISVDKAQRRLDEIKEILESRGIFFHLVDADPPLPDLRNFRVLGKIRADYLSRLQRSFMYLDVRGILQVRKLVKIRLEDVYVPLHAVSEDVLLTMKDESSEKLVASKVAFENIRGMMEALKTEVKVSISEVLQYNRVVILGIAGSGKSTLIKYIVLTISAENANEVFGLPFGILPIIVSIRSYAEAIKANPNLTLEDFLPLYYQSMGFCDGDELSALFSFDLHNGNCIVLLDGLDEVREYGLRIEVGTRIKNFIDEYGEKNKIVVTSRITGYMGAQLPGDYKHYFITEFTNEDIREFSKKWCLAFEKTTNQGEIAKKLAESEAEKLINEIHSNTGIEKLASNPLLLAIIALVHYQGMRLPPKRVELYELCVKTLAETWNLARNLAGIRLELWLGNRPLDERYIRTILGPVALWMHDSGKDLIPRGELEERITKELQNKEGLSLENARDIASDLLNLVVEYSGLLLEDGPDLFRFMHQTFQEYLAAKTLTGKLNVNKFILKRVDEPHWREPILLTAALLEGEHAEDLVRSITNFHDYYEPVLHRHLIMAAWCLVDDAQVSIILRRQIITGLKNILIDPMVPSPLQQRIRKLFFELYGGICYEDVQKILIESLKDSRGFSRSIAASTLGELKSEKAVENLIDLLKDPDSEVRQCAARALGSINCEKAIKPLLEALTDSDEWVRIQVIIALGFMKSDKSIEPLKEAMFDQYRNQFMRNELIFISLGKIGSKKSIEAIKKILKSSDGFLRYRYISCLKQIEADWAVDLRIEELKGLIKPSRKGFIDDVYKGLAVSDLGKLKSEKYVELLTEVLKDSNAHIRAEAIQSLGRINSKKAVKYLIEALKDPEPEVQIEAILALNLIKHEISHTSFVFNLLKKALNNSEWFVREKAVRALSNFNNKKTIELLIKVLKDPENYIRKSAVDILGELKSEKAVENLIDLLKDPDSEVRQCAARALGSINCEKAIKPLIETSKDIDFDVRASAIKSLGMIQGERSIEILLVAIKDRDHRVRLSAVKSLELFKSEKAIIPLIESLKDSDEWVRIYAADALCKIRSDKTIKPLIELLKDNNRRVQESAFYAIEEYAS